MPEIVQEIGAAAGLAAVVGLAVLSALYFSQARDVKRLREWAGRAPERAAEQAAAQPAAQQPAVAQPRSGAVQPIPGRATPAPGSPLAAAAGARPAAATAAAQNKQAPVPAATASAPAGAGAAVPAEGGGAPKPGEPARPDSAESAAPVKEEPGKRAGPPETAPVPTPGAPTGPGVPGKGVAPAAVPAGKAAAAPQGGAAAPAKPAEGAPAGPDEGVPAKPGQDAPAEPVEAAPPKPADGAPAGSDAPPAKPAEEENKVETVPRPAGPATPAGARPSGQPGPAARIGPPPVTSRGGAPSRPASASRAPPSQTAILSPPGEARRPWHRRLLASPRYLVLAIAGVLIIGGAAAFGLAQLAQEEAPSPKAERTERFQRNGGDHRQTGRKAAPVVASRITVSVLNGTTVPGLAAKVGDRVEQLGFQLGNVTNNSDQSRNESVVMYAPGNQREAAAVGRKLRIAQREPVNAASQALAGDAGVVVIAGNDQP